MSPFKLKVLISRNQSLFMLVCAGVDRTNANMLEPALYAQVILQISKLVIIQLKS